VCAEIPSSTPDRQELKTLKVISLVAPNRLRSGCGKLIAQVGFVECTKANPCQAEGLKDF